MGDGKKDSGSKSVTRIRCIVVRTLNGSWRTRSNVFCVDTFKRRDDPDEGSGALPAVGEFSGGEAAGLIDTAQRDNCAEAVGS
jgi:hypothetical protein